MIFQALGALEPACSHRTWLHELRGLISTASVATRVGRELLDDDAQAAADMLDEANRALARCRELLDSAAAHVQTDASVVATGRDAGSATARRRDDRPPAARH